MIILKKQYKIELGVYYTPDNSDDIEDAKYFIYNEDAKTYLVDYDIYRWSDNANDGWETNDLRQAIFMFEKIVYKENLQDDKKPLDLVIITEKEPGECHIYDKNSGLYFQEMVYNKPYWTLTKKDALKQSKNFMSEWLNVLNNLENDEGENKFDKFQKRLKDIPTNQPTNHLFRIWDAIDIIRDLLKELKLHEIKKELEKILDLGENKND